MEPDLRFEEDPVQVVTKPAEKIGPIQMLINTGLVKNSTQATYVLIGIIILCVLIVLSLFVFTNDTPPAQNQAIPGPVL